MEKEKRGRGGKLSLTTQAPAAPKKERRLSMFEKESVSATGAGGGRGPFARPGPPAARPTLRGPGLRS